MKKFFKVLSIMLLVLLGLSLVACEKIANLTIYYEEEMVVGDTMTIEAISSIDDDIITFENLSPEIITIDGNKVIALDEGIAQIIINSSYKASQTISIYISEAPAPSKIDISIKGESFLTEVEYQLEINVTPGNASKEFNFVYTSSALSIDEETLKVTFLKAGKQVITCFSKKDRAISATISVDVDFNPEVEVYELLFVGNSLTQYQHDIPAIVVAMMKEKGLKVNYTLDGPNAQWIIDHKSTFDKYIVNNKYTHVILQEKSEGTVSDYNKFESAVLEFKEKIDANGAQLVLYQTWAYNTGWGNMSEQEMYIGIKNAYQQVANMTNAMIVPAGEAFMEFENMYGKDPSLYFDTHHPSEYGAFLSACVHYATLTGRRASEVNYVYPNIDENYALIIKNIADKVVFGE